ncbi:CapA family protein [Actinopolymorpha singaporensis]|uniref:Poly-gamma-glutamate synthesis protein (Capsule biosynthesis protein) n=1 Tax=Actinopolymorpha singaporensis TaxID=117157 RepID=A0A1H1TUE3_9ACTN|nr:CapA family protein [Actinopolymorpha singaporensis]SDS63721.1 poly-gamma-glutamate synthesis protein (capsule biosynthesis protein) [Actinopolymorpha singaporensis]
MSAPTARLSLCGDVMLGRGVDQILPHPGDATLREAFVRDARTYVGLAEEANGPIARPVDFCWPWGDALDLLDGFEPSVRVVNVETSITKSDAFAPRKAVHYRISPPNVPCLSAARPDVCVLANNHVLDFGYPGLEETLRTLAGAGLRAVGAGRNVHDARRPAIVPLDGAGRAVILSVGMASSGIPEAWAASERRPGIDFLAEPSQSAAADVAARVQVVKRAGDVAVVSVHWGSNWGYDIADDQVSFAHALVDGGVDVVHGHSSHHPRPVEVYEGKLILYGCGDFIDDYEGITGYEEFRDDLRLLFLVSLDRNSGQLVEAKMAPLQARRMRLRNASGEDSRWLCSMLDRVSRRFGSRIDLEPDGLLVLRLTGR